MASVTEGEDYWRTLNQVPELAIETAVFLSALNTFLSITASFGNVLTLVSLRNVSSLHPVTKLLLRCLAVTDLCVGLISQPLFVSIILNSVTKINIAVLYYDMAAMVTSSFILSGVSISTLMALSVDRLLALLLGLRYRQVVTLRRVSTTICYFWFMCVACGFVYSFWSHFVAYTTGTVLGLISSFISIFSYMKIFLTLRQRQAQVQFQGGHERVRGGIPLNIARYKRTVSSIAWVQLALAVSYVPFYISVVIIEVFGWRGMKADVVWTCTTTLLYCNSSLNPILYCWRIKEVRQAMKNTAKRLFCLQS